MPFASSSLMWIAGTSMSAFGLALFLGMTLAALARLQIDPTPTVRPAWQAALFAIGLTAILDFAFGANIVLICTTIAGALCGVSLSSRRDFAHHLEKRPRCVALAGCLVGAAVTTGGFAHVMVLPARLNFARAELALAVFIGALIFATSAIVLGKLCGVVSFSVRAMPGDGIAKSSALLLCGWLGYAFVTEDAPPLGLPALAAIGALACAIGVHSMMSRKCSNLPPCAMEQRRRGLLASIEWQMGDEPAWAFRTLAPQIARSAADRKRRARSGRW